MSLRVTGIGWVGPDGWGRGGSTTCPPFRFERQGGSLPDIRRQDVFDSPYKDFGRMDAYSRLGLAAVALALEDAGLAAWSVKRPVGLIAGTVFGCLQTDFDYYRTVTPRSGSSASPSLFTYTLPNCFLGDAAIRFGLSGPAFSVTETVPSGLAPIVMAVDSLVAGEVDQVLCGVCDLGRPLQLDRLDHADGGALFLMLEAEPPARGSGYGTLRIDPQGALLLEDDPVETISDLVSICLKKGRGTRQPE